MWKWLKRLLAGGGVLILVVLMGFIPISLAPLRDTIRDLSYAALGVEIDIAGSLYVRLGLSPSISGADISVGVPEADSKHTPAPLVSVSLLQVSPGLFDILRGDIYFKEIEIDGVDVDYCASLPVSKADTDETAELPSLAFDYIGVTDIRAFCGDANTADAQSFDISKIQAELPVKGAVLISAEAQLADLPVKALIESGNLNELLRDLSDIPLQITADLATLSLNLNAQLQSLESDPRVTGQLTINADDPDWLAGFGGAGMPELGALTGGLLISAGMSEIELSQLALRIANAPVLESEVALVEGVITADLDSGVIKLIDAQLQAVGSELRLNARLEAKATCPKFVISSAATDIDLQAVGEIIQQQVPEAPELGGVIGALNLQAESCGQDLEEHIRSMLVHTRLANVGLAVNRERLPVVATSLTLDTGWAAPVQMEFTGEVLGELTTAAVSGGTVESLISGAAAPLNAQLLGAGAEMRFNGRTGIGSALDAYTSGIAEFLDLIAKGDQPFLEGEVSVAVLHIGSLHGLLGVAADSDLAFSSGSRIFVTTRRLVTEKFAIQLGDSDLRGKVDFIFGDGRPTATITARSDLLDVEEMASLLPETDGASELAPNERKTAQPFNLDRAFVGSDINLPAINVDVLLEEITGSPLLIQQVAIGGQLQDQRIKEARLSLLVEETPFRGGLNTDLRSARKYLDAHFGAENVDLDRILEALGLPGDQSIEVARTDTRFSASGKSIREFIKTSHLDIDIRSLRWADKQMDDESSLDIDLEHILISMTPEQHLVWQSEGYINKVRVNGWAATPSLYDLLGTESVIPFQMVVGAKDYTVMLAGSADRGNTDFLGANVVLSGMHTFTPMDQIPALESPLAGFELGANFQAYENGDFASQLRVKKGSSQIEGSARIGGKDGRQKLDIELNAPKIQTEDFVQLVQQWREARQFQADGEPAIDAVDTNNTAAGRLEPDEGNLLLIVDDYIDQFVERRDLELRLNVADLSAKDSQLGNATLRLQLDQEQFRLDPLQVSYADGEVNASYVASTADESFDAQLDVEIDNLEIGGLLPLLNPDIDIATVLYLDADLAANAPSKQVLGENINGEISLLLIPEEVDASILDLWATNLVLALLPTPDTGGDKTLNCMVARFDAEDGIIKSKSILLDSTDIIVRGRGSIDIPRQQLDLLAAPQAKRERFFSVSTPVRVTGPWDDFQIGVEPGGFIGTMFRWYMALIYVPFKWLTGERFPADGLETCFNELDLEVPPELAR